ncbi:uncharacterized protein LOC133172528 [Saccostrea echinata]|uniref:uncharacterized protein LOC133172528 n=1 Tax=Saccostrea echinata TaxID=191078 RepID=UPI002A83FD2D|nr:uncharacterized protein LOC133172528 [Saccostrea echinata]
MADKVVKLKMELSADNPVACKNVSSQGRKGVICMEIVNLKIESSEISGCLNVLISEMEGFKLKLGCFKMPYSGGKKFRFRKIFRKQTDQYIFYKIVRKLGYEI